MIPLFFGPREAQLYGAYDAARSPRLRRAVLIVNPSGWEYVRAHRTLRLLASRLASSGVDVFRFDYSGTGDSWGDTELDPGLDRWLGDAELAAEELESLAGVRRLSVVGLRTGARVALELVNRASGRFERLVLWDPQGLDDGDHDGGLADATSGAVEPPALRVPQSVQLGLRRPDAPLTVPEAVRTMCVLSDGCELPSDLVHFEAEVLLRDTGAGACWKEERSFGAGAVPTPLIERIAAWLRN